jgi:hypothetical protein
MKAIDLLETYPKAATVIKEFYYEKMINSLQEDNDIPQEFKDMVKAQQFDSEYIATFIDNNPRFLFDIFDANDVYIQITVDLENNCFRYSFDGGQVESNDFLTRIAAETRSIEAAFEILNEKL